MLPSEVLIATAWFLCGSSLVFSYCRHTSHPEIPSDSSLNKGSATGAQSRSSGAYLRSIKDRRGRLFSAIFILIGMFAVKLGYEQVYQPDNYYSKLESRRHSSGFEIRQAFKRVSLKLHPDKSDDPNAPELFQELKYIYDVLIDDKRRDAYNRFGEAAAGGDPRLDEVALLLSVLSEYLAWALLIFAATIPASARGSRTWIFFLLLCLLGMDSALQLSGAELPHHLPEPWSHVTEWEVCLFMHRLLPGAIVALIWLSEYFYLDDNLLVKDVLTDTVTMQKEMLGLIQQLQASLAPLSHAKTLSSSSSTATSDAQAAPYSDIDTTSISLRIQEVGAALQESNEVVSEAIEAFRTSSPGLGTQYHWVIFVAFYVVVYLASG